MAEKGQKLRLGWLELVLWFPKISMEQEVERSVLASSFLSFLNELVLAFSLWDGAMYHQGKSSSSINCLWKCSHWHTQRCTSWVPFLTNQGDKMNHCRVTFTGSSLLSACWEWLGIWILIWVQCVNSENWSHTNGIHRQRIILIG